MCQGNCKTDISRNSGTVTSIIRNKPFLLFSSRPNAAFTLIELLVVIAIIALLVSILLPSLNKAKDLAKDVECKARLKTLGTALVLYQSDYDGILTPAYHPDLGVGRPWEIIISPYLEHEWKSDRDAYFNCPSDTYRDQMAAYFTYAINNIITDPHPNAINYGRDWLNVAEISNPASVYMLMDSIAARAYYRHPSYVAWRHFQKGENIIEAANPFGTFYPYDCSGNCNISYIDGHVEKETYDEMAYDRMSIQWNGQGNR